MKTLTLQEFYQASKELSKSDIFLDVRNLDEHENAHIKGSINIPVNEIPQRVDELKKYENIFIYCKRGGRAQMAYQTLNSLGFTNLICLAEAGMDAWVDKGYEHI